MHIILAMMLMTHTNSFFILKYSDAFRLLELKNEFTVSKKIQLRNETYLSIDRLKIKHQL